MKKQKFLQSLILLSLIFFSASLFSQSGGVSISSEGTEPHESAGLDVDFDNKGFLPPRMTQEQRDEINEPAVGLIIYNLDLNCIEFWNGSYWNNACSICPENEPVAFLYNNQAVVYYSVRSETGRCWLDRNLGASQVAASSSDAVAYGDLFQWGRAAEGHQDRNSGTYSGQAFMYEPNIYMGWDEQFIIGHNNWLDFNAAELWQGVSAQNNPCPSGWRIPTRAEWEAEITTWESEDATGAFSSPLKLPASGTRRSSDGGLEHEGVQGHYWSDANANTHAFSLYFFNYAYIAHPAKAFGKSVRCIKN